jgi:hypothetical protein
MATTSNRGYPYPTSGDDVRPHEDIEALADAVDADVEALDNPVFGRLIQPATQGLADNTLNMIQFGTSSEVVDVGGSHSESTNNTRVTPTAAGWYDFRGCVAFGGLTATAVFSETYFRKNGTTAIEGAGREQGSGAGAGTHSRQCQAFIYCNGTTDYVELAARQDSGGAASTVVSFQYTSTLEWIRIGG